MMPTTESIRTGHLAFSSMLSYLPGLEALEDVFDVQHEVVVVVTVERAAPSISGLTRGWILGPWVALTDRSWHVSDVAEMDSAVKGFRRMAFVM